MLLVSLISYIDRNTLALPIPTIACRQRLTQAQMPVVLGCVLCLRY